MDLSLRSFSPIVLEAITQLKSKTINEILQHLIQIYSKEKKVDSKITLTIRRRLYDVIHILCGVNLILIKIDEKNVLGNQIQLYQSNKNKTETQAKLDSLKSKIRKSVFLKSILQRNQKNEKIDRKSYVSFPFLLFEFAGQAKFERSEKRVDVKSKPQKVFSFFDLLQKLHIPDESIISVVESDTFLRNFQHFLMLNGQKSFLDFA
jgi:hypothetical protein